MLRILTHQSLFRHGRSTLRVSGPASSRQQFRCVQFSIAAARSSRLQDSMKSCRRQPETRPSYPAPRAYLSFSHSSLLTSHPSLLTLGAVRRKRLPFCGGTHSGQSNLIGRELSADSQFSNQLVYVWDLDTIALGRGFLSGRGFGTRICLNGDLGHGFCLNGDLGGFLGFGGLGRTARANFNIF